MTPLFIQQLEITNMLGIKHLTLNAGQLNIAQGRNGSGKTSLLSTIQAAFGRGNYAHLIREGESHGEAVFVLSDGNRLRLDLERDAAKPGGGTTTRQLERPDGTAIKRPTTASWLESHLNPASFNPVAFLTASPRQQIEQLVRVAKLRLATKDFLESLRPVGGFVGTTLGDRPVWLMDAAKTPELPDPLRLIEMARRDIYERRTGFNTLVREKRGHVEELRSTLPKGRSAGWIPDDPTEVRNALEAEQRSRSEAREKVGEWCQAERLGIESDSAEIERRARDKRDAALKRANEEFAATMERLNGEKAGFLADVAREERQRLEAIDARHAPRIAELNQAIGTADTEIRE
ncbi:MAG: hypothetical protein KGR26_12670, partial [Cyanobacteria bacterium REEB65]|nr:hypothetical protein [Cyanobacteria bacterium REEB65]